MKCVVVAKVGGSLFDLADLRQRLLDWIGRQDGRPILFVPGGGDAAEVIRGLDCRHGLGEAASHWLALRVLTGNAHFLANLLSAPVVGSCHRGLAEWLPNSATDRGALGHRIAVLDAYAFCRTDESNEGCLEHTWRVTSDSVAARVAVACRGELVLFKSRELPDDWSWQQASAAGFVDQAFAELVIPSGLSVTWVNLRRRTSLKSQ